MARTPLLNTVLDAAAAALEGRAGALAAGAFVAGAFTGALELGATTIVREPTLFAEELLAERFTEQLRVDPAVRYAALCPSTGGAALLWLRAEPFNALLAHGALEAEGRCGCGGA